MVLIKQMKYGMAHDPKLAARRSERAPWTPTPKQSLRKRIQAALDAGDPATAISVCETRLQDDPNDAEANRHLGSIHAALGEREAAFNAATRATAVAPDDPRAWSDLGRIHAVFGNVADAIAAFERAIALDDTHADGWHNLGAAHKWAGDRTRAFDALKRALKIDPTRADSYMALGNLLVEAGQIEDAVGCFKRAVKYDPGRFGAATRYGHHVSQWGQVDEAATLFRHALGRDPDDADAWFGLGRTLEDLGEREGAAQCYLHALQRNPGHGLSLSHLLPLAGEALDPAVVRHAETALSAEATPNEARALIGYGLAKHHDRRGAYAEAADAGREANAARRRAAGPLDRDALAARVDGIAAAYNANFFRERRGYGVGTDQPVFIVGLPRSGTTLVEQILSAHPMLHGAGELPDLARLAMQHRAEPGGAPWRAALALDQRSSLAAAHAYLEALRRGAPTKALRISDKSPLNFLHLAFAALLFPNARVIHCTRDIRDTALSVWMENFNPDQQWASDFDDLAFFAGQYRRLMAHWREVLPLPILEVAYEDTVADVEGQARRLLDFLGVPWDDRCLDFHASGRAVQTPSRWQVRQPIYTRSVGRWRRYAEHLPELERAFTAFSS
jgi:tetratricopeptide (TPR) repeat protein